MNSASLNTKLDEKLKILSKSRVELEEKLKKLNTQKTKSPCKGETPAFNSEKDYEKAVKRIRDANLLKESLKNKLEDQLRGANYYKNRNKSPVEFSFTSRNPKRRSILVNVEIELAPGKVGRIAVGFEDSPEILAKNFSMAYKLGKDTQKNIEKILQREIRTALLNS